MRDNEQTGTAGGQPSTGKAVRVFVILLAGLAIFLGGMYWLNHLSLAPPDGSASLPPIVTPSVAPAQVLGTPTTVPTVAPSAAAAASPTVVPQPSVTTTPAASSVPAVGVTASSAQPTAGAAVTVTVNTTPASTATPATSASGGNATGLTTEQIVAAAYRHYLQVVSDAYWTGDTSHLSEVAAGDTLDFKRSEIDSLRARGMAVKFDEENSLQLYDLGPKDGWGIRDRIINRSILVDAKTKQPLETPDNKQQEFYVQMKFVNGTWKAFHINQTA